jgi:Fe-S cluster assembly protein SufD
MPTAISRPSLLDQPATTSAMFPQWFATAQADAWAAFQSLPAPRRGDEAWRFSTISALDFSSFLREEFRGDASKWIARSTGVADAAATLVFVNDTLVHTQSRLPDGVICLPLAEALMQHPDLVKQYFMRHPTTLGSAKFSALHTAHVSNGVFLHVPAGVVVEHPVHMFHWIDGENAATLPHTLVVTEEGASVRVIETFQSTDDRAVTLTIAVNDLIAEKNSSLDYVVVQALNQNSKIISINASDVAKEATSTSFLLSTGAAWARSESISRLTGEEARSSMLAVSVPSHDQEYDQRTFQHHISPGAYSDLLYKNSLYAESRTIFSGLIFVDEGAHRTDAYQTCRNLLMSNTCEANSMPGLEINADDVKCSHGSTSAQISDEEIFYLRARGIDSDTARQLIARGFCIDVISRLHHDATEAFVLHFLDQKFATLRMRDVH